MQTWRKLASTGQSTITVGLITLDKLSIDARFAAIDLHLLNCLKSTKKE